MNKISVDYVSPATIEITVAEFDLIQRLYNPLDGGKSEKVVAIKFFRMEYDLGLKAAKDICDNIGSMIPRTLPFHY